MVMKKYIVLAIVAIAAIGFIVVFRQQRSTPISSKIYNSTNDRSVTTTADTLVEYTVQGGLCQYGSCLVRLTIQNDGLYQLTEGSTTKRASRITRGELETIKRAINEANFMTVKQQHFTGTCPTEYDGREVIYSFQTATGAERISSCQYVIDQTSEPFKSVLPIIQPLISL